MAESARAILCFVITHEIGLKVIVLPVHQHRRSTVEAENQAVVVGLDAGAAVGGEITAVGGIGAGLDDMQVERGIDVGIQAGDVDVARNRRPY